VRVVRQHLTFVSGGPFQWAMALGLGLPDEHFARFRAELTEQRDLLAAGLRSIGLHVLDTEGTYFITTDVRPLGYADGLAFCRDIPTRARVVAIPHQGLCDDPAIGGPYVRWAFCKKPEVLNEAISRLQRGFGG
jgi:N-succinyldiaminopimelate aminotransferase